MIDWPARIVALRLLEGIDAGDAWCTLPPLPTSRRPVVVSRSTRNAQGRLRARVCGRGHRYDDARVDKQGWRHCRICRRLRERKAAA